VVVNAEADLAAEREKVMVAAKEKAIAVVEKEEVLAEAEDVKVQVQAVVVVSEISLVNPVKVEMQAEAEDVKEVEAAIEDADLNTSNNKTAMARIFGPLLFIKDFKILNLYRYLLDRHPFLIYHLA